MPDIIVDIFMLIVLLSQLSERVVLCDLHFTNEEMEIQKGY